jgi:uncharacterized protein involved in tolerance to divalent cations
MTDKRIVLCTAGSEEEARKIARHLVEQRLAACVNIVPQIESIYRWQGKVDSAREWSCSLKQRWKNFRTCGTPFESYIPTKSQSASRSALKTAAPPTWNGSANRFNRRLLYI